MSWSSPVGVTPHERKKEVTSFLSWCKSHAVLLPKCSIALKTGRWIINHLLNENNHDVALSASTLEVFTYIPPPGTRQIRCGHCRHQGWRGGHTGPRRRRPHGGELRDSRAAGRCGERSPKDRGRMATATAGCRLSMFFAFPLPCGCIPFSPSSILHD